MFVTNSDSKVKTRETKCFAEPARDCGDAFLACLGGQQAGRAAKTSRCPVVQPKNAVTGCWTTCPLSKLSAPVVPGLCHVPACVACQCDSSRETNAFFRDDEQGDKSNLTLPALVTGVSPHILHPSPVPLLMLVSGRK